MKFSITDLDAGQLQTALAALNGSAGTVVAPAAAAPAAAAPFSPAPLAASAPAAPAPMPAAAVAAPAAIPASAPAPTPAPVAAPAAPAGAPDLNGVIAAMGVYVKSKTPQGAALAKQILTGRYNVAKAADINPAHYADAIAVFSGQIDPFAAA